MNQLLKSVRANAAKYKKTIVLAEGEEPRIITAAVKIQSEGIAKIILLGDPAVIERKCPGVDLTGITVINIKEADREPYAQLLYELRKAKGCIM